MSIATGVLVGALVASFLAAGAMNALQLPGAALPAVLVIALVGVWWGTRGMAAAWRQPPLERQERALLAFAVLVGLIRLTPYAYQYAAGVLVAPVTWDDNWHFQEVASLVNAERYPPRLNFAPHAYFHFYYVPLMPAAAISSILLAVTGAPMVKLGLALGALALVVGIAWGLIVIVRHLCPPPARIWALAALLLAGATVDGLFALRSWLVSGQPVHVEWWQLGLLVTNSFSALSSSLIWVPHHLISGVAMLLAVVVATEPVTLAPREGRGPYIVAGLLIGTAAFSSIFAFAGGLIALSPLIWELLRAGDRRRLAWLIAASVVPALPLAYIYLGADARGGFVVGQAFAEWSRQTGNPALGIVGIALALALMVLEIGWLYLVARRLDTNGEDATRMRCLAAASALMLASTALIGFTGSNNWALRATIVPVVLLAAYAGRGISNVIQSSGAAAHRDRTLVLRMGAAALFLAALAHINETALLARSALLAPAYEQRPQACAGEIRALNAGRSGPPPVFEGRDCLDTAAYHIERPFIKATLTKPDRELMGRGFGFMGPKPPH
jgi:hypothetical protein